MMSKKIFLFFLGVLLCVSASSRTPIAAQEPLDGRHRIFQDELLDHLVGDWKLTRQMRGQTAENTVKAEWVLQHQFLRVHMKDVATPPNYEAMIFIGYDNTSESYVAHWIDVFGGRFSETLGYGVRDGNRVKFIFEYPDGPFHNTFNWNAEAKTWTFLMEQKDRTGKWKEFALDQLHH